MPVVLIWKLLKIQNKGKRLAFIRKHKDNSTFMHLLWLNANSGLAFRTVLDIPLPRPQAPVDTSKVFIKLANKLIKNPFNKQIIEEVEDFVVGSDQLSAYIYSEILNKRLPITQNDYNTIIIGSIKSEPYEIISKYGMPSFPCICQVQPIGVEALVTVDDRGTFLKDKGGCPIGGFDVHLDVFKSLNLYGTFNVVVAGYNKHVYLENAKGASRVASSAPIIITDYQADVPLSTRLSTVEIALIGSINNCLVLLADSFVTQELNDIAINIAKNKHKYPYNIRVVARQDVEPVLWTEGVHSIDITHILTI